MKPKKGRDEAREQDGLGLGKGKGKGKMKLNKGRMKPENRRDENR